jgi:regulator of protease activity HflC (stomatin/prohibitin superfamily)
MQRAASQERTIDKAITGYLMIPVVLVMLVVAIGLFINAGSLPHPTDAEVAIRVIPGVLILLLALLMTIGFTVVEPNMSRVLILFGNYKGTLRHHGFFWVNPFTIRRKISLRVRNFNSETIKVNDLLGNPIEIGSVVVWKVEETAQAAFDVEDFEDYVGVQTESAIRHLASEHPYDISEGSGTSLRGSSDIVNEELEKELSTRLSMAGIDVIEARLSHLAYSPEIAGAMLQRQQAEAIIQARTRIVDGAVGMVEMALDHLKANNVVELDEERKAQMVCNLLVVLCSDRGAQPVVNSGTLYG